MCVYNQAQSAGMYIMPTDFPDECPGYKSKPFYGEAQVVEVLGMLNTPSLLLLTGHLWPRVIVAVKV